MLRVRLGIFVLTGAGCAATSTEDAARIVPEALTVSALPGGNGVLELIALTLRQGPENPEVYAAVKNRGDTPACDAALSIELFDQQQQSLAAGISGLLAPHFYRRTSDSDTIVGCVGPGDISMAAITDLPTDLAVEAVGFIVYRCPYFALEVDRIPGLSLRDVRSVTQGANTTYTGQLVNAFDLTVSQPAVSVFPIDHVGRPLGMVSDRNHSVAVPPGGSWTFETGRVDQPAHGWAAFAEATLSR